MVRAITALNGRLPETVLRTVGRDAYGRPARFRVDAAASWERMRAAGMPHDVTDTYRDITRQEAYWRNPPNAAGLASYPGRSWHGEGLAVDARGACLTWLAAHGRAHGWVRTIAREPWHFEYDPDLDQRRHTQQEDDDMPTAREVADAILDTVIPAGDGGLPAQITVRQALSDIAVHTRKANASAASAAGRAQTARDEIKLHREAARKGDE